MNCKRKSTRLDGLPQPRFIVHSNFDWSSKNVGLISKDLENAKSEVKDTTLKTSLETDTRLSMTASCKIIRGSKKPTEFEEENTSNQLQRVHLDHVADASNIILKDNKVTSQDMLSDSKTHFQISSKHIVKETPTTSLEINETIEDMSDNASNSPNRNGTETPDDEDLPRLDEFSIRVISKTLTIPIRKNLQKCTKKTIKSLGESIINVDKTDLNYECNNSSINHDDQQNIIQDFSVGFQPKCDILCSNSTEVTPPIGEALLIDFNESISPKSPPKAKLDEIISSLQDLEMTFPSISQPPLKPIVLYNKSLHQSHQQPPSNHKIHNLHQQSHIPTNLEKIYERALHPVANYAELGSVIGEYAACEVAMLRNESALHDSDIERYRTQIAPPVRVKGVMSTTPIFAVNLLHSTVKLQQVLVGLGDLASIGDSNHERVVCTSLSPRHTRWLAGNLMIAGLIRDTLVDGFWFIDVQPVHVFENTSRVWHSESGRCYCACVCASATCSDSHAFAVFMLESLEGDDFQLFASVRDRLKEGGLVCRSFMDDLVVYLVPPTGTFLKLLESCIDPDKKDLRQLLIRESLFLVIELS
ncbi:hypothetical protein HK096_004868 [Nowakowskiella sp. JEL0078]|nr:hypothetical protein HK096_004868 [Nowakowskiella sp. JEL0078]